MALSRTSRSRCPAAPRRGATRTTRRSASTRRGGFRWGPRGRTTSRRTGPPAPRARRARSGSGPTKPLGFSGLPPGPSALEYFQAGIQAGKNADLRPVQLRLRGVRRARLPGPRARLQTLTLPLRRGDAGLPLAGRARCGRPAGGSSSTSSTSTRSSLGPRSPTPVGAGAVPLGGTASASCSCRLGTASGAYARPADAAISGAAGGPLP